MKSKNKDIIFNILIALVIALVFNMPYLIKDFLGIEHDTFFHLARIEGLATSIKEGNILPAIYPYKNNGFGYASPLFYSDFFLYIPSILYLLGLSLANSYKVCIFLFTFIAALSMLFLLSKISKNKLAIIIGTLAYTFSNYHISDVYVRGALGEVSAMMFLPLLLDGIYELLYKRTNKYYFLTIGLIGLILSHNLSFLLGMVLLLIFVLINIKSINKRIFLNLFKGCFWAFLITLFYTVPMLEQVSYQEMYLHYYGKHSSLESYTIPFWKYFVNKTVFGYGENYQPLDKSMLVNVGWYLTFIPLLYIVIKKKNKFITSLLIAGYIFMILPSNIIPWKYLSILRILQFPWRLEIVAMLLLSVVVCYVIDNINYSKVIGIVSIIFICIEGIYHLIPVYSRTFGISSLNTYEDITSGKLCDPYYSATYKRVELCGGDYLPLDSVDFRSYSNSVKLVDGSDTNISYLKNGTTLTFEVGEEYVGEKIVLPITIYKGYKLYVDGSDVIINRYNGLISFECNKAGSYTLRYENTPVRNICIITSGVSVVYLIVFYCRYRFGYSRNNSQIH